MSYPGASGVSSNSSRSSLPPRPPPLSNPSAGFKPAFSGTSSTYTPSAPPNYPGATPPSAAPGYGPVGTHHYGAVPATTYSSYPQSAALSGSPGIYQQSSTPYNYPHQSSYQQQGYYGGGVSSYSPPQIRNPFPAPAPAANVADYDTETAAQIAQWQSAYMPKSVSELAGRGTGPGRFGSAGGASSVIPAAAAATTAQGDANRPGAPSSEAAVAETAAAKKKTVVREGGGKKWTDDTLLEWDPSHLRLFVGNLAGEVTDESLLKAFSRWSSVQKAKVIRDKRTNKSKGYGFVSFSDPDDFFQAAKEMNGKYIQSHPVVVHKAKTEIKPQVIKEDRHSKGKNHKKTGTSKSGSGPGKHDTVSSYEPHLGAVGGGITKPGQRTKGGLKLLG